MMNIGSIKFIYQKFRSVKWKIAILQNKHKTKLRTKTYKNRKKSGTHTLRHAEVSKPGGRFPLGTGSICKNFKTLKINKGEKVKKILATTGRYLK